MGSPNFIFTAVNLDPIVKEKRWTDDESWPNDFVEKVKRGEDLRWVGSTCPGKMPFDTSIYTAVWEVEYKNQILKMHILVYSKFQPCQNDWYFCQLGISITPPIRFVTNRLILYSEPGERI